MGLFENFPYTNFHEINLDQIIKIMRQMQDEWQQVENDWDSMQDFINNYFDNLDVSEEVLQALQTMAGDGELNTIIEPVIVAETASWLAEHITPTSPAVDNTLSIAGAAADAKATGDAVADLKEDLETKVYGGDFTAVKWIDGFIYNDMVSTNSAWQRTEPFFMKKGEVLTFTGGKGDTPLPINAVSKYENGAYTLVKSYNGTGLENISYTAPVDMYAVVSVKKDVYSNNLKIAREGSIPEIEDVLNNKIPSYVYNDIEPTTINITDGSVRYTIENGKTYLLTNNSNNNLSLALRTTPGGATTDTIVLTAHSTIKYTAIGDTDYIVSAVNATFDISSSDALLPFIKSTTAALGNYGGKFALVDFAFSKDMFNFSSELEGVDFLDVTGPGGWYTIMDVIYQKFDALVSSYSPYITKVDAGADVNLTYPAYANLNGSASGNYSATPTYKTYMYKLETNNTYVNGELNKKKKLLLVGATHGSETAGAFNLYLIAKNLCECANEDYFKLRSAYDVYIVPCLNGYGMYHYTRWNADGVNINRNYPTSNFEVSGEPYQDDYTGPSGGSEFETQIIIKLHEKYDFDVTVDHHNYGAGNSQFYTESWYERFRPLSNAALVDCAYSFIKNKSSYFGNNYNLFVNVANSTMPNAVLSNTMPCMAKWFFEKNIDYSATIEISNTINYVNGALSPSAENPKYTPDVFAVGEFTLRNQLLHYCGFVLGGTGN